jgi:hypothetical protein
MTHSLEPSHFGSSDSPADWTWRLEDASGAEVASSEGTPRFPAQSEAESWVGEVWQDLLEEGVEQVRLFEGDREVYGPMSLRPAGG